jgi:hypothetical protein
MITRISKCVLVSLLLLMVTACIGARGQTVAYASFSGNGDVRFSDDGYGIAVGEARGSAGIYVFGSGFPLVLPYDQDKNTWVEFVDWKPARSGVLGVDPFPARARMFYRTPQYPPGAPSEFDEVMARFGFAPGEIPIEPDPIYLPDQPPSDEPPAEEIPTP